MISQLLMWPVMFLALMIHPAFAQSTNEIFHSATEAYKKQNLDEARQLFQKFLEKTPSSEAYYDLGLVEYDAKNIGSAVALWRKALMLDPHNQLAAESLAFIQKKIEHPELNRQTDNFEILKDQVLNKARVEYFLGLTLLVFAISFWLLLSYLGERKRSREQELRPPAVPWICGLTLIIFALSLVISGAKVYDLSLTRATVLPAKIQVLSAPDAESTSLFELFEGLEVIVVGSNGDFVQVTFPGGMTGWTLKKNLMISGGKT